MDTFSKVCAIGLFVVCVIASFFDIPSRLQGSEEARWAMILEEKPDAAQSTREQRVFELYDNGCFSFDPIIPNRLDYRFWQAIFGPQWYDNPQMELPENARMVCPNDIQLNRPFLSQRYYEIRSTVQFEVLPGYECKTRQELQVPNDVLAYKKLIDSYYMSWGVNAMAALMQDFYDGLIEDSYMAPTASGLYRGMYFMIICWDPSGKTNYTYLYNYYTNDGQNSIQYKTSLVIDFIDFVRP